MADPVVLERQKDIALQEAIQVADALFGGEAAILCPCGKGKGHPALPSLSPYSFRTASKRRAFTRS
jgi:hypothetical protein